MVRPHFSDLFILVVGNTTIICQSLDQWIFEILFLNSALNRPFQHPVRLAVSTWCSIELNQWDLWSYSPLCYFLHCEESSLIPCNGMCDPILVNQASHMLSSSGASRSIVGKGSKSISEVWAILVRTDHLLLLSRGWYVICNLCSEARGLDLSKASLLALDMRFLQCCHIDLSTYTAHLHLSVRGVVEAGMLRGCGVGQKFDTVT